jgi:hypothetical protein
MRNGSLVVVVLVLGLSACGDEETTDTRGYTKAPLETPAVMVGREARTEMDRLGVPNRPRGEEIATPVDSAAGGS